MASKSSHHRLEHRVERLVFFSDAVFAIAITLLVIEIKVPHFTRDDPAQAISALIELGPSLFGFALSFLVIGRFWIGHHSALSRVEQFSSRLLWPNLLLLMSIAFMPFATAFMAQNFGQTVPMAFYNATLFITAVLSWRATNVAYDFWPTENVGNKSIADLRLRGVGVILGAASALVLSFFLPDFSQLALLSMPVWLRLARAVSKAIRT